MRFLILCVLFEIFSYSVTVSSLFVSCFPCLFCFYSCTSVLLSVLCLSFSLSICTSASLSVPLSFSLPINVCLSVCLSVIPSVCLSVCVPVCLSVSRSVCLPISYISQNFIMARCAAFERSKFDQILKITSISPKRLAHTILSFP